jgi:hypothetical protein
VLEHEFVQIQPGPSAHITSDVSTPFLSTFVPIVHDPLAPQLSVQPPRKCGRPKGSKLNLAPGSENPNVRRPVGRPRGSGRRQREAAAQAAERAALGLAQIRTAQKRPVGRPRKDKEDSNGVFVELRASVSLLTLYFVCKF